MARREPSPRNAPASLLPEASAALADLDRLGRQRPELEGPGRTLARLIAVAFPLSPPPVAATVDLGPDPQAAIVRLRESAGPRRAALHSFPLTFDREDLRGRGLALCRALAPESPLAEQLARAVEVGRFSLEAWVRAAVTGEPKPEPPGPDPALPGLVDGIARLAALPALASVSDRLSSLGLSPLTPQITCPCCGAMALLAEARGLEQQRFLRCGWCAMAWSAPRLTCPDCGTNRPGELRVYHGEGQGDRYRLLCCRRCDLRLRIVSTLGPLSPPALLVAELASVHLDLIAIEESDVR